MKTVPFTVFAGTVEDVAEADLTVVVGSPAAPAGVEVDVAATVDDDFFLVVVDAFFVVEVAAGAGTLSANAAAPANATTISERADLDFVVIRVTLVNLINASVVPTFTERAPTPESLRPGFSQPGSARAARPLC